MRCTVGGAASSSAALAGSSSRSAGSTSDVGAGELAQLAELDGRPRRLHRAAPAERRRSRGRPAALIAAIASSVVSVGASSSGGQRQHARDVERDVPVARSRRRARARGRTRGPGSRGGRCTRRRTRSRATSRGDPRPGSRAPVGLRAERVDDRVVALGELLVRDVAPDLDVPEEPEAARGRAIFSNARETALMFGWSGATPSRTSPHGVGSRSIRSTSTAGRRSRAALPRRRTRRARSRRRRRGTASLIAPILRGAQTQRGSCSREASGQPRPVCRKPGSRGDSRATALSASSRSRSRRRACPRGAPRPPRPGTSGRSRRTRRRSGCRS